MHSRQTVCFTAWLFLIATGAPTRSEATAPSVLWTKELATDGEDVRVHGLAVNDAGQAVIVGETSGGLFRPVPIYEDGFVATYDAEGVLQWSDQFGFFPRFARANEVVWTAGGEVVVSGRANYPEAGDFSGSFDSILIGYRANGQRKWSTQFGTSDSETAPGLVVRGNRAYVAGDTYGTLGTSNAGGNDAYLARVDFYSNAAIYRAATQVGTNDWDIVNALGATDDAFYVAGGTHGQFGFGDNTLTDAMLIKFDSSRRVLWRRQYGSASQPQSAYDIAVADDGSVYMVGFTYELQSWAAGGLADAFLAKFSPDGNLLWERFLITTQDDEFAAIDLDDAGNVYVGGYRNRPNISPSSSSALVRKYTPNGEVVWTTEFDIDTINDVSGVAVSPSGDRVWVAGTSYGSSTLGEDQTTDGFLTLLEVPLIAGDLDGDGVISLDDHSAWAAAYGGSNAVADATGDGVVDAADYAVWRDAYAATAGTSVPEPSSIALLAMWGGSLGVRRRTRPTESRC